MNIKTIVLPLVLIGISILGYSQILDHQAISSLGGSVSGSLPASYTAGGNVITTASSQSIVITQGFEQPLPADFPVGIAGKQPDGMTIRVWPNPVSDLVTIQVSYDKPLNFNITLYNQSGQAVRTTKAKNQANTSVTSLDLSLLPPGTYIMNLSSEDGNMNSTYKVVKK
ncbi:MAG: T9SS type A sorting domain-containing protein [Bacteroidota bacterium]